jgi:hypothetical protein
MGICSLILTLSDPTSDLVRHYDFPIPLQCRKTSDTFFFVAFVLPLRCRSLSDAFPHVVLTSNPPTTFQPRINKSWGVLRVAEKLDWKGLNLEIRLQISHLNDVLDCELLSRPTFVPE